MTIDEADAAAVETARADIRALVRDSVEGGSSIGFVLPVGEDDLDAYVDGIVREVGAGTRVVALARDGAHVVGMAQLELAQKPNAGHRAEVQKVVVHRDARRQGLAKRLMADIEERARARGRRLLVLDTEEGSEAIGLYRGCGYTEVGPIPDYARTSDGGWTATVVFYKKI